MYVIYLLILILYSSHGEHVIVLQTYYDFLYTCGSAHMIFSPQNAHSPISFLAYII